MTTSPYPDRQKKLVSALGEHGMHVLALNPGPTLHYLTGLSIHLSERPVVFLFSIDHPPHAVAPELERGKLSDAGLEVRIHTYGENPATWERAFKSLAAEAHLDFRRVAIEPQRLRVMEIRWLENVAPRSAFLSADPVIGSLRSIKDDGEIALMRQSVQIAQRALQSTLPVLQEGVTEREVASELVVQLLQAGSETPLPFDPIVAFGDHAANPHAVPGNRSLARGDLVLVDWGASTEGYASDLTRVFCLDSPGDEIERIAEIVQRANQAAFETAGPGVATGDVDAAARQVIDAEGFGAAFIHRTGHGIGLDVHEEPYIRGDDGTVLQAGMTFTVEPGIYVPGLGGVRIEDDVVITPDGAERLSDLPRSLVDLSA